MNPTHAVSSQFLKVCGDRSSAPGEHTTVYLSWSKRVQCSPDRRRHNV